MIWIAVLPLAWAVVALVLGLLVGRCIRVQSSGDREPVCARANGDGPAASPAPPVDSPARPVDEEPAVPLAVATADQKAPGGPACGVGKRLEHSFARAR